jgi:hypothetical protein
MCESRSAFHLGTLDHQRVRGTVGVYESEAGFVIKQWMSIGAQIWLFGIFDTDRKPGDHRRQSVSFEDDRSCHVHILALDRIEPRDLALGLAV